MVNFMKVLITGGYGFIGSHIADKFYREGYDIFIVDNLTNGKKQNFAHKHRFYELSVEDKKCEEVFRSNEFDVVIHLAAQTDEFYSMKHSFEDTKINILGLVNILELSAKYKVKKFIFASSSDVYGEVFELPAKEETLTNPITIYGLNKLLGEAYCKKWSEHTSMDIISFRMSNVYGPRQCYECAGGVVTTFLQKLIDNKPVNVYGDGEQLRDFVYVEDVADAYYKAASIKFTGVLNLSSNKGTSINQLITTIEAYGDFSGIQNVQKRNDEISSIVLDNEKIIRTFDWVPDTDLVTGINKTYEWLLNSNGNSNTVQKKGNKVSPKSLIERVIGAARTKQKWFPYIENAAAFGVLTWFNITNAALYKELPIDLSLLIIIVFSIIYGSKQGIASFVLSIVSKVIVYELTGRDPITLLFSSDFFLVISFYVFVAFIIGYIKDGNEREILENKENIGILNEKMEFLTNLYHDMRDVKEELQNQIVNSEDSFGKIFSIVQELDTLKPEEVFAKAVRVLEKLMRTEEVAIYRFTETSRFARLMACSSTLNNTIVKSLRIEENPEIVNAIVTKDLFVSRDLLPGRPIMVIPVYDHQSIVGGILIYKVLFEKLTLSYENYFRVITDLISSSLSKAYLYDAATESEKYISGTTILKPESFAEMMNSKRSLKKSLQLSYVALKVDLAGQAYKSAYEKISTLIRDTDFIGMNDTGNLVLVLGNTNEKESEFVQERLKKMGIKASPIIEVSEDE